MKIRFLILVLLFFSIKLSFSQKNIIKGYVSDINSGEKIIGAVIFEENTNNTVYSNEFGFYSITVSSSDTVHLTVYNYDYKIEKLLIPKTFKDFFNIKMEKLTDENIDSVVVYAYQNIINNNESGVIEISVKKIALLPSLGGETDIFKALQFMPGIQSGSEGRNGLYVRGGSPDQNLILLDDIPLYYVSHLGGFVSVFNTDAINNVKLYKSGFPAKYGGRLSSVVDVRMKDGDLNKFKASGSLGLISSKIAVEGPIVKNKSSFILTARRFMLDLLSKPISKSVFNGLSAGYTFYDLNGKLSYKFSDRSRLFFSFYSGNDNINTKYTQKYGNNNYSATNTWGNDLAAVKWNVILSDNLFVNTILSYTKYKYSLNSEYKDIKEVYNQNLFSGIEDYSFKTDFNYNLNNSLLNFGVNSIYHKFSPEISSSIKKSDTDTTNIVLANEIVYATENSVYAEYKFNFLEKIKFTLGARSDLYNVQNKSFIYFSPRILFNFILNENFALKGSYTNMQQNIHLLTNSGAGVNADVWMPATKKTVPEKSNQTTLEFVYLPKNKMLEFSAQIYYKNLSNLISYKEGESFLKNSDGWESKVETGGIGISKGLEILIQKKSGKMTGWLSYTLSKSERKFENINNGEFFPFKYDRRHDINIVYQYQITERTSFSATWTFGSGLPVTIANSYFLSANLSYNNLDSISVNYYKVNLYGGVNSIRMRTFHKLDISAAFMKPKKHGKRIWNVSIYNVYNRRNPYYYYFDEKEINDIRLYQKSFFPFIPSLSYSFILY